jgi:RimJ/RimL family protein N-acetyltransferase
MKQFRVYLRALEYDDYKATHKWHSDSEIVQGYGAIKHFVSTENEKKWIEHMIFSKDKVAAGICLKETNELIGLVFLTEIDLFNKTGHCPTFIGEKKYWGEGYATEARILILKYAFYDRGLQRVFAIINEDNIASQKMVEKCGYQKEGLMRKSAFKDGQFVNQYMYAILKEEFDKLLEDKYKDYEF